MKTLRIFTVGVALVALHAWMAPRASGAETPPQVAGISVPQGGSMQILFRSKNGGPFRLQTRKSMDATAQWLDVPGAAVTEIESGVYMALVSKALEDDIGFFRVVSEHETVAELKGWNLMLQASAPANGKFFAQGESPIVTLTILDTMLQGVSRTDFSALNLYMYGPQDPQLTVTASKLLNASTDRTKRPHHYIDLKTNPDVQVAGSVLTYRLQPVTDEAPGTYRLSLWASLGSDTIQQVMKFADLQIGTATAENPVVTKTQCAACHEGPISGKVYMHHIDPGYSPTGNWALDFEPVTSCKACHNNDGYASFKDAAGATVIDPIILRAHGVHMGEELKSDASTNAVTGAFRNFTHVVFPADVRDCTKCHVDERWKTQPSRLACGTCHDDTWFGTAATLPKGMEVHPGGAQANDTKCTKCHAPDGDTTESLGQSVAAAHKIPPHPMSEIAVSMSAPANGKYYVAGEKPVVSLVFKDDAGKPIDHTQVTEANFSTAAFFVYGPRARAVPVLTTASKDGNSKLTAAVSNNQDGPWTINGKKFKIAINGSAPQEITVTGASAAVTPAEFVAVVNPVISNLNGGATASVSGARVSIRTKVAGDAARIEIYNGDVTTAMVWKRGNVVLEPDVTVAAAFTVSNDLRSRTTASNNDPRATRTAANIAYQLDDVASLTPGSYNVYTYHKVTTNKVAGLTSLSGLGHLTFQVGTTNVEKKVATNCADCHGDTVFHLYAGNIHPAPFDTDYCTACHDYGHVAGGDMFKNQGGTSLAGWSGYGAMPISRRVHGVHRGAYLDRPEEIYANATKDTFGHIIFPQDIRNCTKCHAESDTWKQKPSRVACLACHDSDEAKAHGNLMTFTLDPSDPYGPLAVETCKVCHGAGAEFSPDKVHRISNPYVPPYPREPAE